MEAIPRQLEPLRKSGQQRGSRSGPESRYLRTRGGFCLGFMAEVAVAEDYLVLAQRVHQQPTDNAWAAAMVERVERECGARPGLVLADSGHDNSDEIQTIEAGGSEAIIPDPLLAHEWMTGAPAPPMNARQQRARRLCWGCGRSCACRARASIMAAEKRWSSRSSEC